MQIKRTDLRQIDKDRFFAKVCLMATSRGCFEWTAYKRQGYGRMGISRRLIDAHRLSWLIHRGEIPEGLDVLHECDNPSCVNPEHLFLGTHTDNMRDRVKKGRHNPVHGEAVHTAKLNADSVMTIRHLWETAGLTQQELAYMFGVSRAMIGYIVRRKSWKSVEVTDDGKKAKANGKVDAAVE